MSNKDRKNPRITPKIEPFLQTVPLLSPFGGKIHYQLADRFRISPKTLSLLVDISKKGGANHEN